MKEMEAKDLRIGNLIYVDRNLRHVCGTCYKTIMHNYHPQNSVYSENYESECEPIPLTEEWLLKFGFTETIKDSWYSKSIINKLTFHISISGLVAIDNDKPIKAIEYVHQLQNLYFALTGTELEYNERK
jgi:hypothetical protein